MMRAMNRESLKKENDTATHEMMGLEFGVTMVPRGKRTHFCYPRETLYNLLCGRASFIWENQQQLLTRTDCFHESAVCLHVPRNTAVIVECLSDYAEIAVASTENSQIFAPHLLCSQNCVDEEDGHMCLTRALLNRSICPETNFAIGEVVHMPGNGSSYLPRQHLQPEMYYYKFLQEETLHANAAKQGYTEYYLWCIRLREEADNMDNA